MVTQTKITQNLIAKQAGVSRAAVSIALSSRQDTSLSPETRERILCVAEELGYAPRFVQTMPGAAKNTLCLIIPDSSSSAIYHGQLFWKTLMHAGVVAEAEKLGYRLSLSVSDGAAIIPDTITQGNADGIITDIVCARGWVEALQQRTPVVLLNYAIDDITVDSVMPDNAAGMMKALTHLCELGHRHIAVFGVEAKSHQFAKRFAAFIATMATLGLPCSEAYVAMTESATEVNAWASAALERWSALAHPPTAVIALNDVFASCLMRMAQARGMVIPTDLSIIGFDNDPSICLHCEPQLTTIDHAFEQIGRIACQLLVSRIADPSRPSIRALVDVPIIVRGSTGPAPIR
ncbi:MAG TPA: LacI family DNA-binding transcriptional regulator [Armatimonadota bacterium]|jgi:LacI family transcriptional regulator